MVIGSEDTVGPAGAGRAGASGEVAEGSRQQPSRPISIVLGCAIGLVALVPRLATALGGLHSIDEHRWMVRSERFIEAVIELRWSEASSTLEGVATMPGITTTWVGGLAKLAWTAAGALGIANAEGAFALSDQAWILAQAFMACANSALIVVLWWLLGKWIGPIPAAIAAVLLATEPFMVAHGAVLHTDSFITLLGWISMVAWLLAVGADGSDRAPTERRTLAVIAGLAFAGALLTKLNAVLFGPFLLAVLVMRWRAENERAHLLDDIALPRLTAIASLSGVVCLFLAWPALWADPVGQLEVIIQSAELSGGGHLQFFRGDITWTPGMLFYPVVVLFRVSPWLLAAALAGVVVAVVDPARRSVALASTAMVATHLAVYSTAAKQLDRYALVLLPLLAVLAGIGLARLHEAASTKRWLHDRHGRLAAGVISTTLLAHAIVISPWSIAWYNPVMGGGSRAEDTLLIGWGEGLEIAGERIQALQGGECVGVTTGAIYPLSISFPCGDLVDFTAYDRLEANDYLVLYIGERQRTEPEELAELMRRGTVVDTVWIRGIRYADIIRID